MKVRSVRCSLERQTGCDSPELWREAWPEWVKVTPPPLSAPAGPPPPRPLSRPRLLTTQPRCPAPPCLRLPWPRPAPERTSTGPASSGKCPDHLEDRRSSCLGPRSQHETVAGPEGRSVSEHCGPTGGLSCSVPCSQLLPFCRHTPGVTWDPTTWGPGSRWSLLP